jgi:hypothetical protein
MQLHGVSSKPQVDLEVNGGNRKAYASGAHGIPLSPLPCSALKGYSRISQGGKKGLGSGKKCR